MTLITGTFGWGIFLISFVCLAKSLWFFYYFSLYFFEEKKLKNEYLPKTALVVPIYNEEKEPLIDMIKNALKTKHIDQYVFINDGSTNDVSKIVPQYLDSRCKFIDLKKNKGKREAQIEGLKLIDNDTEVVIYIDSDTIMRPNSVLELLKPMADPLVGGVTAKILVRNRTENFLTRCLSAMYWTSSEVWRKAPSNLDYLQVTNGQLSCYKYKYLKLLSKAYITQDFMGVRATMSDDRWLTHHLQTDFNLKMKYASDSVAYTYVPNNIKQTFKMMCRWKRGSLRESILVLKRAKSHPLLIFDIWANHIIQLLQIVVRVGVLITAIFYPIVLLYYMCVMIIISLFFAYEMLWENIKEVPFRLGYTVLNEFIFWWTLPHSIVNIRNQGKWSTR